MFERAHHQLIAALLKQMDAQTLLKNHCLLSGGTAILFTRGEYREALQIEFVCTSADAYRTVRQCVDGQDTSWLFRESVQIFREPNFDRHGIRLRALQNGAPIKIEVILENRISTKALQLQDRIEGVWCLSHEDLVATKLMANAVRYADDSFLSRDIIDLSMITADGILSTAGVAKARSAYGTNIDTALARAKAMLLDGDEHLAKCMRELKMTMPAHELRMCIQRLDFADSMRWWE